MKKLDVTPFVIILITTVLVVAGIAIYRAALWPTMLSAQAEPLSIPLKTQWQPTGFKPKQIIVLADEPVTYTLYYDVRYRQESIWYTDTLQSDCVPHVGMAPVPASGNCGATITATVSANTEEVWMRLRWQPVTNTVPTIYGVVLPTDCDVPAALCQVGGLEGGRVTLDEECVTFLRESCQTEQDAMGYWLYYAAMEEPYCGTPYPTATPYPPQPTYTPRPTYTPTPTATPCVVQPTYTPNPTYTPYPTATEYPT